MTERTSASGKNLRISALGQILTVVINFLTRRIFINLLGAEYTGFSGLCAHVLNLLSLLEPGFDSACIYFLYRPLAYGDKDGAAVLMGYLKRIYRIIGVVTFVFGIAAFPLLLAFSSKTIDTGFAFSVYLIMLFETAFSFFLSHRFILPLADQKSYVNSLFGCLGFALSRTVQLLVLCRTQSFILYLLAGLMCTVVTEIIFYVKVGNMYPYIKHPNRKIPTKTKKAVNSNAASLFFRKCGNVLCGSADNMAVFAFLGLAGGTVYSNYTMLSGICLTFISLITSSASGSIGNLGVTNGKQRMYKIHSVTMFSVVTLSAFFAQALFFTYPLIIRTWIGKDMVLGTADTALFCISMFVSAIRRPTCVFLDAMGLFKKEKYKALTEAAITLAAIFTLTPILGIKGVLIGQLCASLLFSFPCEIYILFRFGFDRKVSLFLGDMIKYLFALILSFVSSLILCIFTFKDGNAAMLIGGRIIVCAFSVVLIFFILFFDTDSFSETARYAKKMVRLRRSQE